MADREMEVSDEFPCEGYTGVHYEIQTAGVDYVAPEHEVGLNTVTYVQGVGLSLRTVSVPGSASEMFFEATEEFGTCDCIPPAVWVFTGYGTDGTVVVTHALNGHDAIHLLRHPDHLFDDSMQGVGLMTSELNLVPVDHGLEMVFHESKEHLAKMGVPDLIDDDAIKYDELSGVDMEELFAQFFQNEFQDGEEEGDENTDG